VALRLRNRGISNVRPLLGGLDGWRERGYPIVNAEDVDAGTQLQPIAAAK
jgi:3-mercaptopyruvate sulfurtransferase SseA